MSKVSTMFAFTLGAAAGAVVSWRLLKKRYEIIADEEIESVKEWYARKYEEKNDDEEVSPRREHKQVVSQEKYEAIASQYNKESIIKEGEDMDEPYVIPPEEFGEEDGYETESLTYYADGVLTDDADNIIENIDATVGADFASHFGEFEDDSVFVRNPVYATDYEILADGRSYSEVVGGTVR